jgi:ATP-dependent Lhr-like helicase
MSRTWTRADALVELLRGRLTTTGPLTSHAIAESLSMTERDVDSALLALEADGAVLRGRFSSPAARSEQPAATRETPIEWCDRALLARIHRYTLNRLRAEIEPVSPSDFMRFLFSWQHVETVDKLTSIDGLREVISMLDGFEAAASAWERAILPARMDTYNPQLLDMLCFTGELGWARVSSPALDPQNPPRLVPATPVALFLREHADAWQRLRRDDREVADRESPLPETARHVFGLLTARGASFFTDLVSGSGLSQDAVRQAVGSLVAAGLVTSDGFSGVRALIAAARGIPPLHDRRTKFAGRWTILPAANGTRDAAVDTFAGALLRRYGVVFRRLLTRESNAVPWRDLTRVYRRLEARGELRGGRFVSGMSGEQFALPEAVERLRAIRRSAPTGKVVTISAADPLNLAGIVTAGERIRAASRTRIAYRNGVPIAVKEGDVIRELTPIDADTTGDILAAFRLVNRRSLITHQ